VTSGAIYESWVGNRWFGTWLLDDCLAYRLAERFGQPVTTARAACGHAFEYELRLGMAPRRLERARFDELIVFRDFFNTADRKARADDFRRRLVGSAPPAVHPGVFLLRGQRGTRRVLANERALAEQLARTRGLRLLDPESSSVAEIVAACAGARVVAGVEGSQLVHGLMLMPPAATLLVLQPPDRVASVLKSATDRQGQRFAFVVGIGDQSAFRVDPGEVLRTLDLAEA
jgi:hypothetical protein